MIINSEATYILLVTKHEFEIELLKITFSQALQYRAV
jgi:hypothetical protein